MNGNQRQYFRCSLESHPCVLIADRRKIPCELVEMSLGGFAITVADALPKSADPLMRLKVRDLEYIVRVTRQDGQRVALEQVEEVVPPVDQIPATWLERTLTRAAWLVAFCVVVAALYCLSGLTPPLTIAG